MSTDRFTEIINYLSAMSRDFGEFRQEFRQFREETNARFEKLESRMEKIELRLDKMELRLDRVEHEQRQTAQLINRIAGGLFTFRADLDELQARLFQLENKGT
jgi:septal ring factor EnvC (AmiA/AmiB activator)